MAWSWSSTEPSTGAAAGGEGGGTGALSMKRERAWSRLSGLTGFET